MGVRGARRGRPGGGAAHRRAAVRGGHRRTARSDAGHPGGGVRRRLQRHRELRPVVRPPHALPDAARTRLRFGLPGAVGVLRGLQRRLRRRAGRAGGARRGGPGPGLPPGAGARPAPRPPPRPAHRPLLAHAVGTGGVLRDAARRHPAAAGRGHPRRGPRELPDRAVGAGLHRLLRDGARRGLRGAPPRRRGAVPPDGPRGRQAAQDLDRRVRPRRGRGVPARAGAPPRRRGTADGAARADRRGGAQDRSSGSTAPSCPRTSCAGCSPIAGC